MGHTWGPTARTDPARAEIDARQEPNAPDPPPRSPRTLLGLRGRSHDPGDSLLLSPSLPEPSVPRADPSPARARRRRLPRREGRRRAGGAPRPLEQPSCAKGRRRSRRISRLAARPGLEGRLAWPPRNEIAVASGGSFEVARGKGQAPTVSDRALFGRELGALVAGLAQVKVAEFLITAIEVGSGPAPSVRTDVRYDIVGTGPEPGGPSASDAGGWSGDAARKGAGASPSGQPRTR